MLFEFIVDKAVVIGGCIGKNPEMIPGVIVCDPASEHLIDEGCYVTEWSNSDRDAALSVARARVRPGTATRWHRLQGTTERYVVLAGEGVVEVGDLSPHIVRAGDVVLIPPGCRQRITNPGTDDLVFLALCTPRFIPSAYEDAEPETD